MSESFVDIGTLNPNWNIIEKNSEIICESWIFANLTTIPY